DNPGQQLAAAQQRLAKGDVAAVYGVLQGGYTAGKLRDQYPKVDYHITGAPDVKGNVDVPGVKHMDQVGAQAEAAAAQPAAPAAAAAIPPPAPAPQPANPAPSPAWLSETLANQAAQNAPAAGTAPAAPA